jgi:hypothetical protein
VSPSIRSDAEMPPPLMTSEPGSFAQRTIVERKPQIIRQVIADNDYAPGHQCVQALAAFKEEIISQTIRPLSEQAPDTAFWNQEMAAYDGKTWLELPWYFAETFFYRRLLEAVRYFQPGPRERQDPFEKQKREQIAGAVKRLAEDWHQLADVAPDTAFETLLHSCLWGNRADLSNLTVKVQARGGLMAREERHNLLIDHTTQVLGLVAGGLQRVDFINDNVGLDLLFDLVLADFMLLQGWVQEIVFHLKDRPFFVSDAMPKDVQQTLSALRAAPDLGLQKLSARLQSHQDVGRLELQEDPFWTSYLMFRDLPPPLQERLVCSDLVVLKGDVNYRRLLSDRHWPPTARLSQVAAYFPAPFLVLRTLKGEILVGLEPGQAERLAAKDPTWRINGKRGIIQLVR